MVHPTRKSSSLNNGALTPYLSICKPIIDGKSLKLRHFCMDQPPENLQNAATVRQSRIDADPMHSNIKRIEPVVGQFDHACDLKRSTTSWWFLLKLIRTNEESPWRSDLGQWRGYYSFALQPSILNQMKPTHWKPVTTRSLQPCFVYDTLDRPQGGERKGKEIGQWGKWVS